MPNRFSPFPMTLRLRLTLWYTALLGITLIIFSVLVYSALAANLAAQFVQEAANQATLVSQALTSQIARDIITSRPPRLPNLDYFADSFGVQVTFLDGRIAARSENLRQLSIPNYEQALTTVAEDIAHLYYTKVGVNGKILVYSVPLHSVDGEVVGAVQVVKLANVADAVLRQISRYLILGTALCLLAAAMLGAWLARRTLNPIDDITRTANSITQARDLKQRLHITDNASEVGQLAATFNEMLDRIQNLFTSQERLIADVSHELRTPLTSVQGNVELLQRMLANQQNGQGPSPQALALLPELLNEVEGETARMNNMIRDLLLLAQADSGVLQLQMAPVEMDTLLLDVYRQTRRVADRVKGAGALEIRLGSEDQALVLGDRERLRQVLLNLTDNAIKYTPVGGSITLGLQNRDGWVAVAVTDTGIGIPSADQAAIFERFYRTDKARSREMGGSGLGLSIARWLAQAHKGRIEVQSAPQQGSTFTLWLPEYAPNGASAKIELPAEEITESVALEPG